MILSFFEAVPLSFGDRELTDRMFYEQAAVAGLVLFPLSWLIGQLSIRLVCSVKIPFLRSDIWNGVVRIVLADVMMEVFLQRGFQCIPFEEDDDRMELVMQSLGFGCPLYATPVSLRASSYIFAMRITAICLGIFIGEGWCPIAVAGGLDKEQKEQLAEGPFETDNDDDDKKDDGDDKAPAKEKKRVQLEEGSVKLIDCTNGIMSKFGSLLVGLYLSGNDLVLADIPLFFETSVFMRMLFVIVISTKDKGGITITDSKSLEAARTECLYRLYGVGMTLFQIMLIMGISIPVAIYFKVQSAQKEAAAASDADDDES